PTGTECPRPFPWRSWSECGSSARLPSRRSPPSLRSASSVGYCSGYRAAGRSGYARWDSPGSTGPSSRNRVEPMRHELYVPRVRSEVLERAEQKARALGHPQLDLDHLVWADATAKGVIPRTLGPHRVEQFLHELDTYALTGPHESDGGGPC